MFIDTKINVAAAKMGRKVRAARRSRVLMRAVIFTPDGALNVRIRDFSSTGAHIIAERAVPPDCDAIFKKGPLFVAARVVWSRRQEAGLTFYRELTRDDCSATSQQVAEG